MIALKIVPKKDFDKVAAIERTLQDDAWDVASLCELSDNPASGFGILGAYDETQDNKHSDKLVGYLIYQNLDVAELLRLGVDKAYQGRGIAKRLTQSWLDGLVCPALLEVRADNVVAIGLYQTLGFKVIHTRKNYYKNQDNSFCDALIMQKDQS